NELRGSPGRIHAWVSPCGSDAMKGEPAIMANLAPRASRLTTKPFVLRMDQGLSSRFGPGAVSEWTTPPRGRVVVATEWTTPPRGRVVVATELTKPPRGRVVVVVVEVVPDGFGAPDPGAKPESGVPSPLATVPNMPLIVPASPPTPLPAAPVAP